MPAALANRKQRYQSICGHDTRIEQHVHMDRYIARFHEGGKRCGMHDHGTVEVADKIHRDGYITRSNEGGQRSGRRCDATVEVADKNYLHMA